MKQTIRFILFAVLASRAAGAELADVTVEAVAGGLATPTAVTHAGDGRLFVSQLGGQVRVLEGGTFRPEPFLDLSGRILGQGFGLYSLAFHTEHAVNGWFFAHYTEKDSGDSIIARYRVSDDPNVADLASETVLLRIAKTQRLHYGGQLAFGPDGYLYVSTGDTTGSETPPDPLCAAQSLASLEGKILRLDVDADPETEPFYAVPPDNPFAGSGRGEIWAYGLRNPWRFSFDRATGDLWVSDVGQDRREEVNRQPAPGGGGENYGWKVTEGTRCLGNRTGCDASVPSCGDPGLTEPVIEYAHAGDRCSVTGGYVYRGDRVPDLEGRYLYGDFCTGEVWAAAWNGNRWVPRQLGFELPGLTSFGEDAEGEILLTAGDTLYRLVDPTVVDGGPCVAGANHLCLTGGRFRVSVSWRTSDGATGLGNAVSLGEDAGLFWFFSANNPEVFVKVLDACFDPFQRFWVFAAGLTDVETSLLVVDTATGESRVYDRPPGVSYEAVRDTGAFATCP